MKALSLFASLVGALTLGAIIGWKIGAEWSYAAGFKMGQSEADDDRGCLK